MSSEQVTCVIGGAGFIGRSLVRQLLEHGRKVVIIDQGPTPASLQDGVTYHQGSFADPVFLAEVLKSVDEVIHLAYASVPKTSFEDPSADLLQNVPPTLVLFDQAVLAGIKKMVVISSGGTVYGQVNEVPIHEDHATNPISPYGITKLTIEKYAGLFFALKQLPVVIVRPANAYGEEQRPYTGQGFIATAVASILDGKELTVFGETGAVRDYIHVEDIASGIIAALEHGSSGEAYNLGTGRGASTKDVIELISHYTNGREIKISHQPDRSFDVTQNILDIQKISGLTGWQPTVLLEEGIHRVWDYQVSCHE